MALLNSEPRSKSQPIMMNIINSHTTNWLHGIALILLGMLLSCQAKAADGCTLTGAPSTPSTANLTLSIPRDLPVGATIPGSRVAINWSVTCTPSTIPANSSWLVALPTEAGGTAAVPGLNNVYAKSDYPSGVGFRFLDGANNPLVFSRVGSVWYAFKLSNATTGQTSFQWKGAVELVKTSTSPATGSIAIKFYPGTANSVVADERWANGTFAQSLFNPTWTITQAALTTCTVTNKDQMVKLPTISAATASLDLNGGNQRSVATPFTISLNCAKGSELYMTFTDASDPSNTHTVIKAAGAGTQYYGAGLTYASPLGGNVTVGLGPDSSAAGTTNQIKIGSTPQGVLNLQFYADYAHAPGVTYPIGPVSANATFTFSYQ